MKLSTRACYGTRAVVDLAARYGQGATQLKDIAGRQELPQKYLENMMAPLRAAGLVKSTRGTRGGFEFAKDPSDVKFADVLEFLEGSMAPARCVDEPGECPRSSYCGTREVWVRIKEAVMNILESVTVEDLVRMKEEKEARRALMYHI